ncbi:hypothetical protein C7S20_04745 [Christiangramia fulva]|uniref:DUF3078 domain-containing protein n=1 Tax=Christiangramia fulva TaxID=2126553 RepID=A0A2R3Z2Z2_9FLAO|nr:DUF3078 domain-containing protein [Christiangramia fulva]AVR44627.1 hypothetical protein C7S20_04745 [Christiangramia fulva]
MKLQILLIFSLLISLKSLATDFTHFAVSDTTATASKDTTTSDTMLVYWTEKNTFGVNLTEVAFLNWNSGGNNSISALFYSNFERDFKKDLTLWKNSASLRYGINAQEGREIRKTDDELKLSSSFGFRSDSTAHWYYSGKFSFHTQFSKGYKYPDREKAISKFMAPGYTFLGVGTEYSDPDEDLTLYLSPLTFKSTFVLDQRLANEGMFGVTPAKKDELGNIIEKGENMRTEFGFLVTSEYHKEVWENIKLDNQLSLYSDYLNNFGNIDVDWQLNFNMKVNDFVKANVGSHIRYDDDVKYKEDTNGDGKLETFGPRIQLKQMLGVGLVYEF